MSQSRLLKIKTYPTNWLYKAYFKFEEIFISSIELPVFPTEIKVDASGLKKGLGEISDFAVSRYLIQDLTNIRPKHIIKGLASLPKTIFAIIFQSLSKY